MDYGTLDISNMDKKLKDKLLRAEKIEDKILFNNKEYKNLVDAHVAISILITQQAKTCFEICNRRIEILKQNGASPVLDGLDKSRGRRTILEWELRSLIK